MWWTRYWSVPGGHIAAGVVHIAVALAVLLLLDGLHGLPAVRHPDQMAASVYHPIGILMGFRAPPPVLAIELAEITAWTGALAMLVGLCARGAAVATAKRPYAEHQTYELIAGRIERSIQAEADRDYVYRALHRETDRDRLRTRTAAIVDELRRRYPAHAIRGARVYVTMYQAPAYPAPARLEAHDLGVLGELVDGRWLSKNFVLAAYNSGGQPVADAVWSTRHSTARAPGWRRRGRANHRASNPELGKPNSHCSRRDNWPG